MTLRWSKTILNPPLDPPYRGPGEYEGEVDMGDYPWIPQVINESRMFPWNFGGPGVLTRGP